jgi:hypothetical protein
VITSQIQSCARKIDSDKESDQLEALTEIRKILSGLKKIYFIFSKTKLDSKNQ